jgi:WhiB family redox-sensing transcriptional regulator
MSPGSGEQLPSLEEVLRRPSWMELAACAGQPLEVFFPAKGQTAAAAKAVCAVCSVRSECYDYAQSFSDTPAGVWGGESERSRKRFGSGVPYSCPVAVIAKGDTALTCTNTGQNNTGAFNTNRNHDGSCN